MNKADLIGKIAKDAGITKTSASTAVDSFIQGITTSLKKNQRVTLVGFGTFASTRRKARTGRNPQTGETIKISAKGLLLDGQHRLEALLIYGKPLIAERIKGVNGRVRPPHGATSEFGTARLREVAKFLEERQ